MEADRLLEQARTELEVDSRISLYQQAEQIIVDDAALIPLWFQSDKYILIKPHVRGYTLTPIIIPKLKNVYIQEE